MRQLKHDQIQRSGMERQTNPAAQPSFRRPAEGSPAIYLSRSLFGAETEIGIEHEGALYRLKITKQGKLVLNK